MRGPVQHDHRGGERPRAPGRAEEAAKITTEAAAAILAEIEKLDIFSDVKRGSFDDGISSGKINYIDASFFEKRLSDKDQPPNIYSRFMYDLLPLSALTSSSTSLAEVDAVVFGGVIHIQFITGWKTAAKTKILSQRQ